MKLYDCQQAPNGRRVRMFLAEKGIDIPTVEVNIMEGENLTPEFLAVNPRGVLPVLELDDGTCIDETVAICRYFENEVPSPALMGTDSKSKAIIESRQRHIEFDGLLPLGDVIRNSSPVFDTRALPGTSNVKAIESLVERGMNSIQRFYDRLNEMLSANTYIAGEEFTIADITALCAVDFAQLAKISIPENHANTLRWYQKVSSRSSTSA